MARITKITVEGNNVSFYFDGGEEPFSAREFDEGTRLYDRLAGIEEKIVAHNLTWKVAARTDQWAISARQMFEALLAVRGRVITEADYPTHHRELNWETRWFSLCVSPQIHKQDGSTGWGVNFRRFRSKEAESLLNHVFHRLDQCEQHLRTFGDKFGADEVSALATTLGGDWIRGWKNK